MDNPTRRDEETKPMLNGALLNNNSKEQVAVLKKTSSQELQTRTTPFWQRGIFNQLVLAGAVLLLAAGCGMPIGYSAVLLPQLQVPNSTLPTDDDIGSWIASVHSAATPIGGFASGLLMDRWGRRRVLQLCSLPLILGWVMIALAGNHAVILAGRIVAGMAVGLSAAPAQVLLGEISEPRQRGFITSLPFVSYSLGILLVYALGATLQWKIVAWLATILPLLSLIAFSLLPESPVWLVRRKRIDEAEKALNWLRQTQARSELEELVERNNESERLQTSQGETSMWSILRKPQVYKPLLVVVVFSALQVVSGTFLVIFYAVDLISVSEGEAGDGGIDKFLAAVLTAVVRLVFITLACFLLLSLGRRPLAIFSGICSGMAAMGLGFYLFYRSLSDSSSAGVDTIVIAVCLLLYVATNTVGFFVLPGIAISELLPTTIRGRFGGFIIMILNLGLFLMAKIFPFLLESIGPHGVFWIFGLSTLAGTLFVYLFFPETKGRSLVEIEDYFSQANYMWITRSKHSTSKA